MNESRRALVTSNLLEPAIDNLLGSPGHRLVDWSEEIYKGEWDSEAGITVRLFGTAVDGPGARLTATDNSPSGTSDWSLVLKVPDQRSPSVAYREREAIFYGSPLVNEFPKLFAPPRLYNESVHGEARWVLMEEIDGVHGREWPVEELVRTAGLLGELQGRLSDPAFEDAVAGLSDDNEWYRRRYEHVVGLADDALAEIRSNTDGSQFLSTEFGRELVATIERHDEFMGIVRRMPRSICHGDFNFMNLRSRPSQSSGETEIVAIDWEYVGFRPIGADVSGLVADSSVFGVRREIEPADKLLDRCLSSYEEGLARGGLSVPVWYGRLAVLAQLLGHWALVIPLTLRGTFRADRNSDERFSGLQRCGRQCELLFGRALPEADALIRRMSGDRG